MSWFFDMIIFMFKWVWNIKKTRRPRSRRRAGASAGRASTREYEMMKESARALVHARLEHFNLHYKLAYNNVFIKNTKTRWGSCSSKGNLNFSYKIATLPPELADYLIVHELCHLKEMNHGPNFWILISETIPDYRIKNRQLKRIPLR